MKHFKSYNEFRLEERYEGVEVKTNRYERVHGRKPRGNGMWAFYFDPVGDEPIFTPSAMNYTDAVKWASLKARNMGKKVIYVGESINEEVNPKIKDEVISRLSDFFRVSPNALKKFNFDGNDNIKELTKALNSTSDQGTKLYYDTAIKLAKEDLGIRESINEALKIGDFVRYKKDNSFTGGKITDLKSGNAIVKNWDGSESEFKLGDLEYVKSWNEAYNGNMSDFKYDLEMAIEDLGISSNAIKKVSKSGKKYEVRMSSYMSQRGTWEKIGELIGATLVDFKADPKSINVGIYERENAITEGEALIFDIVEPEFNDLKGKLNDLNKKTVDLKWRKALDQIQREVEKLEFFISKYDKQLGAIETNESLNEREYSDEERKDMADKGLALPDGSFPIKDLEDLKNAIQAYGRSKDQSTTAKFIVKRAKALSAEDLIPDTEDFQKALKETITEGNAFLAARAKAIEEDAEEFEFNGKKYPVLNRPKKLNEELSDNDAYKIIDIGSKFSKEVGGHLLATQTFDTANDFVDYLLSEFIPKKDHPKFLKSVKSLMESDSSEGDTDEEYIDPATLPQSVKDYVSSNYSDAKITKAESDEDGFEVYLSNGLELIFGPDEKFIKAVKES